jgi:hypothetical protein
MAAGDGDGHRNNECDVPPHSIPPEELARYRVDSDPHSERDIAQYVESQTLDETVQHVEKIKQELVLGDIYEIWAVTTDKGQWWVITNLTNLYPQQHFPSLDFVLSFHIGLMARIRSKADRVDARDATPFDDVFRREEQAENRHYSGVEVEDYQAVGMLLRESLISLVAALRRRSQLAAATTHPQAANFVAWADVLMDHLCGGSRNKELRQHLKNIAKETWQLVNWLTHDRNASRTASSVALHSCQTVIGHFLQVFDKERKDRTEQCPVCSSRNVRTHFDISIPPEGDYYFSCGVCGWTNHPEQADSAAEEEP